MSPTLQHIAEALNFEMQMAQFAPEKHLKEREKQYCEFGLLAPEKIFIVRETEDGWWRESHDFTRKLVDKFIKDPTVAIGFMNMPGFDGNGGWS